jgi:broad specificity phosphatase PhoE
VEQARANGRRLLAHLGQAATEFNFIASPMDRARHTMELVLAELGLPTDNYQTDQRLCEAAYGDWEGLTIDEIQREAGPAFDAREKDRWHFAPPGGESLQMAMERVLPVLRGRRGATDLKRLKSALTVSQMVHKRLGIPR